MYDAVAEKMFAIINAAGADNPLGRFVSVNRVDDVLDSKYMNAWDIRIDDEYVTQGNWDKWVSDAVIEMLTQVEDHFKVAGLKFDYMAMPDSSGTGHKGFTMSLLKGRLTMEQEQLSKKLIQQHAVQQEQAVSDPVHRVSRRLVDGLVRGKGDAIQVDMCFDFDGVIHIHNQTTASEVVAGVPVEGVMDMLAAYSTRYSIAVFSVRSAILEGRDAMQKFIAAYGGARLARKIQFPDHKPIAHWYFDDRAIRIDGPLSFPSLEELEETAIPWFKKDKQATPNPTHLRRPTQAEVDEGVDTYTNEMLDVEGAVTDDEDSNQDV